MRKTWVHSWWTLSGLLRGSLKGKKPWDCDLSQEGLFERYAEDLARVGEKVLWLSPVQLEHGGMWQETEKLFPFVEVAQRHGFTDLGLYRRGCRIGEIPKLDAIMDMGFKTCYVRTLDEPAALHREEVDEWHEIAEDDPPYVLRMSNFCAFSKQTLLDVVGFNDIYSFTQSHILTALSHKDWFTAEDAVGMYVCLTSPKQRTYEQGAAPGWLAGYLGLPHLGVWRYDECVELTPEGPEPTTYWRGVQDGSAAFESLTQLRDQGANTAEIIGPEGILKINEELNMRGKPTLRVEGGHEDYALARAKLLELTGGSP